MKYIALLFVCIALATAQYVRVSSYGPSAACTDTPLYRLYFTQNYCLPVTNTSSIAYWVNGTTVTMWQCANNNCNASGCTQLQLNASTCYMSSNNNITTGYTFYEVNENITADFANSNFLPETALGTLDYATECSGSPLLGAIYYGGSRCAAPPGASANGYVNLGCANGCLTANLACSLNATTQTCQNCPNNDAVQLTKGCQSTFGFNAWIGCGVYGTNFCASSNTTTTTTGGSATSTSGGSATTTSGGSATTAGGATTGSGATTAMATTTGSAASVVASLFLVAIAALFMML